VYKPDYRLVIAVVAPLVIWPWTPTWFGVARGGDFVNAVTLTILVPTAEEIMFRGIVQGGLFRVQSFTRVILGLSLANWSTSLIFAAVHGWRHPLLLLPGYFLVSLVLGYFRERYHGLTVPILLHGYYNLGLLLSTG
jgi:membrane protease YdiL (CAAX protease family)